MSPALAGRLPTTAPPGKPCSSTLVSTLPCKDLDPATLQLLQTQAWEGCGGGPGRGRQDTTAFKEASTLRVVQVHGQPLRVSASLNVAP